MQTPRRTLASVFSVVLAAASLVAVAPAAAATPLGTNLVKNPGAQSGSLGSATSWDTDLAFSSRKYGDPGMPSKAHGNSFGGGTRLFSTGPYDENFDGCGSATQFINITGRGGAIDNGNLKVTLKARLGTLSTQSSAQVTLQFRDSNNHQVGNQVKVGPVSTNKTLVSRSASRRIPDGARTFRVQILGNPSDQTCDAVIDLVNVQVTSY